MADNREFSHAAEIATATDWDRRLAVPMFALTTVYLALLGAMVHLAMEETDRYNPIAEQCGWILVILWPAYWLEFLFHKITGGKDDRLHLLTCLIPPLRLVTRDHVVHKNVWLPFLGWRRADDDLAEDVEYRLGYPMIVVALLILPLLGIQQFKKELIATNQQFGFWVQIAEVSIWQAFAMEFLVMLSLVSKKVNFLRTHWMDAVIVLLPLIAFLRVARIGRVFRLHQLGKLTKTARMFRFKGLAMRAWRAVLVLEIVDRLLHRDPEKRLRLLEEELLIKQAEVRELTDEITRVKGLIATVGERERDAVATADSPT
ncbi:MAG: hypothetical protein KDA80_21160 [Planctomycetaceae bacterium]|nr:hypothetical protein [Planctomycetaceae bacterium]